MKLNNNDDDDEISLFIEKLKPYAGKITFGTVVGYCSGAAAKKIGRLVAVLTGVAFILIQTAASYKYIQIDWEQVKSDAMSKVDSNGDKSISVEDAKYYWKRFKSIMTKNLPSAGGFSLGFVYGVVYN